MTDLRKSMVFMVLFLAALFNIERLDVGGVDIINLPPFIYVFITLLIIAILLSKRVQNLTVYYGFLIFIPIYLVLKIFVFNDRPFLGSIYTYLTITELSFVAISVFLAYDLMRAMGDMEDVLEKVIFPKYGQRVIGIDNASEEIKVELIRSRRHNRPLSVVVVSIDQQEFNRNLQQTIKKIQQAMMNRYLLASLAQILGKEARRTDMIVEQSDLDGFIILCPETSTEGSNILVDRIQSVASDRLGIHVKFGIAAFPEDALTFEELLQKAQQNLLFGPETEKEASIPVEGKESQRQYR
jgi:GGDEF domain-containing protein